jgi:hypothetical protein
MRKCSDDNKEGKIDDYKCQPTDITFICDLYFKSFKFENALISSDIYLYEYLQV